MALLPLFRFIVKQLKRLTRPVPLVSGVAVGILAIFISEYLTHPEWFGTYSQEGEEPSQTLDLSGLTPEEQAAIADIDNLNVLFNDLGIATQGNPTIQILPEEAGIPQDDALGDLAILTEPVEVGPLSEGPSPFEQYLNQYRFGQPSQGLALPTPNGENLVSGNPLGVPSNPGLLVPEVPFQGSVTQPPGQAETSALERAITAQGSSPLLVDDSSDTASSLNNEVRSLEGAETSADTSEGTDSSTPDSSNSQAVTVPGIPFPFLPTTSEMSPPPGTTGYTPPASLQSVQQPTNSTPSSFPSTGSALPSPSGVGVPNLPSAAGVPNLAAPQVDVSNGSTTPSLPSSVVPPASNGVAPPPTSSVPRPPGSYTGNGYINTFSNPSGPPQ